MENQSKFKTSKDIIAYLAAQFPLCFSTEGDAKPLKVGIFQDLVARLDGDENISKVKLRSALRTYTLSWRYLHSIKEGAQRVDLDGQPGETLTAEHVQYAQQQLKEAKDKVKAARAQQQTAQKAERTPKRGSADTEARAKPARSAPTKAKKAPVKGHNEPSKTRAEAPLQPVDLSTIKVGDEVKINLSRKPMKAVLVAIEKDTVRVKIPSGMELTVKAEHIVK